MTVTVLLFAGIAQRAGAREWRIDDLAAGSTLQSLLELLRARHPFLREVPHAIARNRNVARRDEGLAEGDEIALLPPVSGG